MSHQIENIQIVLQKAENQAVYLPGDPLIGIFSFRLVERLSVYSIRIVVDGSTRVKWYGRTRISKREHFKIDFF